MSILNENTIIGASAATSASGDYEIENSLRFNDNDSPYLARTPSAASNRKTWTWSNWIKLGNMPNSNIFLFSSGTFGLNIFSYDSSKPKFSIEVNPAHGANYGWYTNAQLRDPSAWYHIVVAVDTTQALLNNRIKLYLNGVQQTWANQTYSFSQNADFDINRASAHNIGTRNSGNYFEGCMAETHLIDGQALTPSNFGETDEVNGHWKPIRYTGTHGTNGFYLDLKDSSDLGNDVSGNANDWSVNNLVATDQMLDSPTNNFCVLNPLDRLTTGALSEANTKTTGNARVSMRPTTGKWYYEKNSVGVSYDADASGEFNPSLTVGNYNFGQDSTVAGTYTAGAHTDSNGRGNFFNAVPTGFLALCNKNLPTPTVVPSEHFNAVLWTGNGSKVETGFPPDLLWYKARNVSGYSGILDVIRGYDTYLQSYSDSNEAVESGLVTADSTGFTPGSTLSSNSYVAWNWKANGAGVSNTDGTIASTVSANVDAGFSIVSWTATGSVATTGHGLTKKPEIVITKQRNGSATFVALTDLVTGTLQYLLLSGNAIANNTGWGAPPTSTVMSTYSYSNSNTFMSYCFHSVDGYSKFGTYTGNSSTNGTFVHLGFRPAFLMTKTTNVSGSWVIYDNKRDPDNVRETFLLADNQADEDTLAQVDFVSNGFKFRTNSSSSQNVQGRVYLFLAFAEFPFKHSNAR